MNAMQKQNFKNLIQAVAEAKPDDFNMDVYGWSCGTPGCVLGHYAARTDLQQTFTLKPTDGQEAKLCLTTHPDRPLSYDYEAIQEHFGLSRHDCFKLFSTQGCDWAVHNKYKAEAYLRKFFFETIMEEQPC